ncbi:MAG: helix-turn-helix domain-containing protein [Pseudonocardiaceae bacterium]
MNQPTFGSELRRLRDQRGLSLKKFGKLANYDPGYLSKIENGVKPPTVTLAKACDTALHTGGRLASLVGDRAETQQRRPRSGNPPAPCSLALWEPDKIADHALYLTGSDLALTRREALTDGTSLLVGAVLVDPLRNWLLPSASASDREVRVLSEDEVAGMEAGVRYLRTWARQRGGGLARHTVAAQLKDLSERLQSARSGVLRDRAFLAGAQLARLAASLAWDGALHSKAQQYYVLAVEMAHVARDSGYAALAVADLARQSLDLERPQDALELTQLARYGSRNCRNAKLHALLLTRECWAFAHLNLPRDFRRTVAQAEDCFAEGNSASCPSWLTSFDEAEMFGVLGARYRDLALASGEPRYSRTAESYIEQALSIRPTGQIRSRTFDLIGLARTYLISEEVEQACCVARQAVDINHGALHGRPKRKLQDFCRELATHHETAAGRDFTEYLRHLSN